jgi:hypothetical protein
MMTSNDNKSVEECLQLLIKQLRHLQHDLNSKLRSEKFIHNKLINACQDVFACQYVCFKLSDSLVDWINDLRSSIIIYQKANSIIETFETFCEQETLWQPNVNNHTYISLIWYHSTRLIESYRTSSRLIKTLHYWVLWRSRTRKSRSRNVRSEISQRKRVAKSRKIWIFSITQSIFKRFLICLRKTH